jgi:exodeoxyribonuclease VII large subunit
VPDSREVALHLDRLADRLRLAGLGQLRDARLRLDQLGQRARQALQQDLLGRRHRVARLVASLDALSPLAVLGRGYSLTLLADGQTLVRASHDVTAGDLIHTRLASGQITSRVV